LVPVSTAGSKTTLGYFVRDICGIELEPSFERELDKELSSLAERMAEQSVLSCTGIYNPRM